jgi:predicted transcriptional regulator
MKDEILKLRSEGKTYQEIQKELKCSKSTISYYCGNDQKEKTRNRTRKRRQNKLISKLERYKNRKPRNLRESVRKFNKRNNSLKRKVDKNINITFTIDDVINKFGIDTICYLSGEKINLYESDYNFDHIQPSSRNGNNSLDNLGITHPIVNYMKGDLTPEELIEWCIKILKHNGYDVNKFK